MSDRKRQRKQAQKNALGLKRIKNKHIIKIETESPKDKTVKPYWEKEVNRLDTEIFEEEKRFIILKNKKKRKKKLITNTQ